MANIELLNLELKKLSEICIKLKPWVEQGLLDYRRIQSEESILLERIAKLKLEVQEGEETVKKSIQSGDMIIAESKKEETRIRSEINRLWIRAQSKFTEVEKRIDEADRKAIKGMVKELQAVA